MTTGNVGAFKDSKQTDTEEWKMQKRTGVFSGDIQLVVPLAFSFLLDN